MMYLSGNGVIGPYLTFQPIELTSKSVFVATVKTILLRLLLHSVSMFRTRHLKHFHWLYHHHLLFILEFVQWVVRVLARVGLQVQIQLFCPIQSRLILSNRAPDHWF